MADSPQMYNPKFEIGNPRFRHRDRIGNLILPGDWVIVPKKQFLRMHQYAELQLVKFRYATKTRIWVEHEDGTKRRIRPDVCIVATEAWQRMHRQYTEGNTKEAFRVPRPDVE